MMRGSSTITKFIRKQRRFAGNIYQYATNMSNYSNNHVFISSRSFAVMSASVPAPASSTLTEGEFHQIADDALEHILEKLTVLEEHEDNVDISLSQGVLKITLQQEDSVTDKTKVYHWVINKQTPNRQLWWSSPISGPRRYEYVNISSLRNDERGLTDADEALMKWSYTRDGSNLLDILKEEIHIITNVQI